MKNGVLVRYVAGVVVAVFAVGILLSGGKFDQSWLRFFSAAVLVASTGLVIWEHWLWRIPVVQRLQRVPRCIRGTWRGDLTSHWVDSTTGQRVDPKQAFLVVRQSFSSISVVMLTNESKSRSSMATVTETDGQADLMYMYLNKPNMSVEHRSRIHHGSTSLELVGRPVTKLVGSYWTDRDSKGELAFTKHVGMIAEDYDTAAKYFV